MNENDLLTIISRRERNWKQAAVGDMELSKEAINFGGGFVNYVRSGRKAYKAHKARRRIKRINKRLERVMKKPTATPGGRGDFRTMNQEARKATSRNASKRKKPGVQPKTKTHAGDNVIRWAEKNPGKAVGVGAGAGYMATRGQGGVPNRKPTVNIYK